MEHGTLLHIVQMDIGEGGTFWISGYSNPNLRQKPTTNVKPTKITMVKNSPSYKHKTGIYYNDRNYNYYLGINEKGKIVSVSSGITVYDTEEEATQGYNSNVECVAIEYQNRMMKVRENLINGH